MEGLPLGSTATLVPALAVKDLLLGRTLMMISCTLHGIKYVPKRSIQKADFSGVDISGSIGNRNKGLSDNFERKICVIAGTRTTDLHLAP